MKARDPSLDLLRFVAVVLVLGAHFPQLVENDGSWSSRLYAAWGRGGGVGVLLFFVLSGFLVAGLLFKEHARTGSADVKRFLIRRGFKIYPSFWVYTVTVLAVLVWRGEPVRWSSFGYEMAFVQNYGRPLYFEHTWTLAVEEHFYLLLAALIVLLIARGNTVTRCPLIAVLLCIAVAVTRACTSLALPYRNVLQYRGTHAIIDALAFGSLLAYLYHVHRAKFVAFAQRWRWPLLIGGIGALSYSFFAEHPRDNPYYFSFGVPLMYLGAGAVLASLVVGGVPDNLAIRAAALIGTFSYSIYLWHYAVIAWVMPPLVRALPIWVTPWRFVALCVPLALLFGSAMSLLIEWPVLRIRDRLFPDDRSQLSREPQVRENLDAAAARG